MVAAIVSRTVPKPFKNEVRHAVAILDSELQPAGDSRTLEEFSIT